MSAAGKNPWLGLNPYTEADADHFFGRQREAEQLHRLLRRETLTFLYGVSGLGKTSLIRAGLFPRLRGEDFLPVAISLDYARESLPSGQILEALSDAAKADGSEIPPLTDDETLWEYFHREGSACWSKRQRLLTPVIILDQFEEFFTHAKENAESTRAAETFLGELSDLVENRIPASTRERIKRGETSSFEFGPVPLKVVISLREDFLPHLSGLRDHLPTVRSNEMRLLPFAVAQARAVIERPGSDLLASGATDAILPAAARARPIRRSGGDRIDARRAL